MFQNLVDDFLREIQKYDVNLHSLLIMKGNDLVYEQYWEPFDKDTPHRMYSVTKSFVAIAIGCLIDEGKLSLEDKIVSFFPDKQPEKIHPLMAEQTVRNMLMMHTCLAHGNWFQPGVDDRLKFYFSQTPDKPADTLYWYDSTGSYVLGCLVERLSGMSLLDYLKVKVLNKLGGFENAHILSTPDGTPWGDSALLCTPRALMNFARFVMNLGTWNGERLLSESYLKDATSPLGANDVAGAVDFNTFGYGYQIWMDEQGGFSFNGMGAQYAICSPKHDMILVCNGDNQQTSVIANHTIFRSAYEYIFDKMDPVKEPAEVDRSFKINVAHGCTSSSFEEKVNGVTYRCEENPMGITSFRLDFTENEGKFSYTNAQGDKVLTFGRKQNVIQPFPEKGYSDEYGNVHDETSSFMYRSAISAGWLDERKLQIRVQVIDRYFGILIINLGFTKDGRAALWMQKTAEDFFQTYNGLAIAYPER